MKIFIAGTFDNFHVGHQYLLWNGYEKAEKLIVIVARDKTVKKIKGSFPNNSESIRLNRIKEEFKDFNGVDVKLGDKEGDFLKTLEKVAPAYLFLGYDQYADIKKINNLFPKIKIKIMKSYFSEFFKSSKF